MSGDTIDFDSSLNGQTITLLDCLPAISVNVTITGPGASQLTVSGFNGCGVLTINSGLTVGISGLTIANGSTASGGGILNQGTLTVTNSTVSGNSGHSVGGIWNSPSASGPASASYNVYWNNLANGSEDDCHGCTSNTNATLADPKLAPLANYGGPTQTMLPMPGSAAICAGSTAQAVDGQGNPLTTDQRGFARTNTIYTGSSCVDAGAVQTNYSLAFTTEPKPIAPATVILPNQYFQAAVTLDESGSPFSAQAVTIPLALTAGNGALYVGSLPTTSNGVATYSMLQVSAPGTDDVLTAHLMLNGALTPAPEIMASTVFDVEQPTTTTVSTNAATVMAQNPVTFSATVTSAGGTPTGTVSFIDGTTSLGNATLNGSGAATLTLSTLSAGSHSITTVYGGDTNFAGSTSSAITETVQDFQLVISGGEHRLPCSREEPAPSSCRSRRKRARPSPAPSRSA